MPDVATPPAAFDLRPHAAALLSDRHPLPVWWPMRGRAAPAEAVLPILVWAGWPLTRAALVMPDGGRRVVTCVPATWLAELARRCGAAAADLQLGPVVDG